MTDNVTELPTFTVVLAGCWVMVGVEVEVPVVPPVSLEDVEDESEED